MTLLGGAAPPIPVRSGRTPTIERPRPGPGRSSTSSTWWAAAGGAFAGLVLFAAAHQAMPDDALIHASYARNLIERGEWGLVPGIPSNTATSPLWVWLLAGGALVTGSVIAADALLLAGCLAALAVCLCRLGGPAAAVLGTLLVASTPVMSSAVGMESFLAVSLLVGLVERTLTVRVVDPAMSALLIGGMVLTRPDLAAAAVVVVATAAVTTPSMADRRRLLAALVLGGATTLPWFAFSWVRLGSAWPDTVPLKGTMPGWGDGTVHLLGSVPLYAASWPAATWLTVGLLALGALALPVAVERKAWPAAALAVGGVADLAFVAAAAGPPASYYAAPAVAALGLAAVSSG